MAAAPTASRSSPAGTLRPLDHDSRMQRFWRPNQEHDHGDMQEK